MSSFTILQGDALTKLRELPDESVHCCVTSPPYWGLRDYGTAQWEGGDTECDHIEVRAVLATGETTRPTAGPDRGGAQAAQRLDRPYRETCGKCGAKRIDSQLGLEKTPEEYAAKMVEVFREVRRVLRADATCWINMGDSIVNKQLQGIPWRLAFALQADGAASPEHMRTIERMITAITASYDTRDEWPERIRAEVESLEREWVDAQRGGWWLRQDIIWAKPNPMPESVTDRCTKSHEYLFLLTKSASYFYDAEAIKEASSQPFGVPRLTGQHKSDAGGFTTNGQGNSSLGSNQGESSRNKRSVWTVATAPYPEAHFATYPTDLIKPCILAGTSAKGCCAKCGAPWERVTEILDPEGRLGKGYHDHKNDLERWQRGVFPAEGAPTKRTTGWQPCCGCHIGQQGHLATPCTVLDLFAGSGTTGQVALELGRKAILIELNPEYVELIKRRCDVTPGLQLA